MKVIKAEHAGFCFGVKRAIQLAEQTLDDYKPVYALAPLIHNDEVMNKLINKGLVLIDSIKAAKNETLIIRSHGVSKEIYDAADQLNINLIDTTCPYVKKVQKKVYSKHKNGYTVIVVGKSTHPEIIGINGWCNNQAIIINSIDDAMNLQKINISTKVCVVAQTTYEFEKWIEIINILKTMIADIEIYNTICSATKTRQESLKKILPLVDAMIVIGGKHSSNTQKLYSISKQRCIASYHIQNIDDLMKIKYQKYDTIGITAGASTPDWIIDIIINKLNEGEELLNGKQ